MLLTERFARETPRGWPNKGRFAKVKQSMARIKTVLTERKMVYQDTKKRLEQRQHQWRREELSKRSNKSD